MKTILVNVPPGCTSRFQPLHVVINKHFKNEIKEQFQKHLDENSDGYVDGKFIVCDICSLFGNTWERICQSKDMIIVSFKKCDITTNVMVRKMVKLIFVD